MPEGTSRTSQPSKKSDKVSFQEDKSLDPEPETEHEGHYSVPEPRITQNDSTALNSQDDNTRKSKRIRDRSLRYRNRSLSQRQKWFMLKNARFWKSDLNMFHSLQQFISFLLVCFILLCYLLMLHQDLFGLFFFLLFQYLCILLPFLLILLQAMVFPWFRRVLTILYKWLFTNFFCIS